MSTALLLAADLVGLGALMWWTRRMYFGAARGAVRHRSSVRPAA